ncbi:MAG TPA: CPBP family intramembrane glutamic endopeptidase [Stenomitos sp.]
MAAWQVMGRGLLAVFSLTGWSVLALVLVRRMGLDMTDYRARTSAPFLGLMGLLNLLIVGTLALQLHVLDARPLSDLGFGLDGRSLRFVALAGAIALVAALGLVGLLHARGALRARWGTWTPRTLPHAALGYLALFSAAFSEEVVFRGYLGMNLAPWGTPTALVVSTAVFTVWHFLTNRVSWLQVLNWALGGALLFGVYQASGSLWVAALVHFLLNLVNVVVFNYAESFSWITLDRPFRLSWKTGYTVTLALGLTLLARLYFQG